MDISFIFHKAKKAWLLANDNIVNAGTHLGIQDAYAIPREYCKVHNKHYGEKRTKKKGRKRERLRDGRLPPFLWFHASFQGAPPC